MKAVVQGPVSRRYSCPGKIFLLGEYAVLAGGYGLLAAVGPRFILEISNNSETQQNPLNLFPKSSPAERLISRSTARLAVQSAAWRFTDPHEGRGGFGASTAQYLLAAAALGMDMKPAKLLPAYQEDASAVGSMPPSGADLVCQTLGGLVFFSSHKVQDSASIKLPAPSVGKMSITEHLLLFSATGQKGRKTATHEHLVELQQQGFPNRFQPLLKKLQNMVVQGHQAMERSDLRSLAWAIQNYGDSLAEVGWETTATSEDKKILGKMRGVLAVKGTGALQSDALLVLVENPQSDDTQALIRAAEARQLSCVTRGLSLEAGWKMEQISS